MAVDIVWRPVRGFEQFYAVSNTGLVRRIAPGKRTRPGLILKGYLTNRYPMVKLFDGNGGWNGGPKARKHIHRLVAEAFLGPCPDGHEVNHIDGVRTNNAIDNLEYVTHSENLRHAVRIGHHPTGERVKNSKLTARNVLVMRELYAFGCSAAMLSREFDVASSTVDGIVTRRWWKNVP